MRVCKNNAWGDVVITIILSLFSWVGLIATLVFILLVKFDDYIKEKKPPWFL